MAEDNGNRPAFRWNPEISAGTLISATAIVTTIVGAAWTLTSSVNDAKNGVGRVEQRLDKVEPKLDSMSEDVTRLSTQMNEINDLRDRVRELERERK